MRKWLFFLSIIVSFVSYAQEIVHLSGMVIDELSNPISDVRITELSYQSSITTSNDGNYSFLFPCNSLIELEISAIGFVDTCLTLQLRNEDISDYNIVLKHAVTLKEIMVEADTHLETSRQVIHFPTKIEKKHASSGYDLINVMNLPDLRVDSRSQIITNLNGNQLVALINGVEADASQIATLQPKDIIRIEHQRVPQGKWATSAGVVNFVVKEWAYGGNVLLRADECFGYQSGNYLTYFNYSHGNTTYSTTLNGKWAHNKDVGTIGTEQFHLNNLDFTRERNNLNGDVKENSQSTQFMLQNVTQGHRFKSCLLFSHKATPWQYSLDELKYVGAFEDMCTEQKRRTHQSALSPLLTTDYTKYFTGGRTLNISGEISYSHSNYCSSYMETWQQCIDTRVLDNTWDIYSSAYYQFPLPHNIYMTFLLSHRHTLFNDNYRGNTVTDQDLAVGNTSASVQLYQVVNNKVYYYLLGGISNYLTKLNGKTSNYLYPMIFYGLNFNINPKNSLSVTGHYTSTNYSPTYKNQTLLQNSFFEFTMGNPDLKATKVFQQDLSYNTTFYGVMLSLMYSFSTCLDNSFNVYWISEDYLFRQMRNEGNFYSNKAIASASWNTLSDRLRLRLTGYYDHINTSGGIYHNSIDRLWFDASAMWMMGDFMLSASYTTPRRDFWINGPYKERKNNNYSIELSWNHNQWSASVGALNFLKTKRSSRRFYDYGAYAVDMRNYSRAQGRNIFFTITYTMSYGRKTDRGDTSIAPKTTDAIMRTF